MFYQVIGRPEEKEGLFDREILLGCIRIDSPGLVRTVDYSKVAFYAFQGSEANSSSGNSYCRLSNMFLVVTHFYPCRPETTEDRRDVLFFFQTENERKELVWNYLRPGHDCNSELGVVVYGEKALTRLVEHLKNRN